MRLIDRLSNHELKELMGKCWITHDGMWFYHAQATLGMEVANKLNKAAIASLAPFEIQRLKQKLDVTDGQLTTFGEIQAFLSDVRDIAIPDFMNVIIDFDPPDAICWSFTEKGCFAFNGVSMIGVEKKYECGPLHRIRCWLEILGIRYDMTPDVNRCIMPDSGECKGRITLHL